METAGGQNPLILQVDLRLGIVTLHVHRLLQKALRLLGIAGLESRGGLLFQRAIGTAGIKGKVSIADADIFAISRFRHPNAIDNGRSRGSTASTHCATAAMSQIDNPVRQPPDQQQNDEENQEV